VFPNIKLGEKRIRRIADLKRLFTAVAKCIQQGKRRLSQRPAPECLQAGFDPMLVSAGAMIPKSDRLSRCAFR